MPLGAALTMGLACHWASAADPEPTLPTVNVIGEQESYQPTITTIGKMPQAPRDVPASLTIVPEQLMKDRSVDTLKEALRNVPSITFQNAEGGRIGDNLRIRGFQAFNDLYFDGIRDAAQYNRDLFNFEQIDVLRGSASMLFGRGSTGGVVNQVSKMPFLADSYRANFTYGSFDYKRVTADLNKKIGDTAAVRLNLMRTDADTFRDVAETNRRGIAPSFRWGIGSADEFLLSYYYLEYSDVPDYGIPMLPVAAGGTPPNVPVSNFYGLTSDYQKDHAGIATAGWTHRFSNDTSLKTVIRKTNIERDLRAVAPALQANLITVNRGRQARGGEDNDNTLQSDLTSKFELGGFKHLVLAGIEYQEEDALRWAPPNAGAGCNNPTTTLINPDTTTLLPAACYTTLAIRVNQNHFTDTTFAFYAQDIVDLTQYWKVMLGARHDDFQADYTVYTNNTFFTRTDRVWSYRSGLIYQPTDTQSYYLAYGTSFNPSAESYAIAGNSTNTPPEKNRNTEIGGKWEVFDGNLSLRSSLFRSEKTNERNTDALNPGVLILNGRRHTDGVEIEGAGRITQKWEVFAGVSRLWARIDEHPSPLYVGIRPANTPSYTFNLWTTYKLPYGFVVGGGVQGMSDREIGATSTAANANPATSRRFIPAYSTWDGMLAYEQKRYTLRLNVTNLFNTSWVDAPYENGGFYLPGTSRAFKVSAEINY